MKINKILSVILLIILAVSGCSGKKALKDSKKQKKQNMTEVVKSEKDNIENSQKETEPDNYNGKGDRIKRVTVPNIEKKKVKIVQNYINTDKNSINKYFLLSEIPNKLDVFPEDYEIGALFTGMNEFANIYSLINNFFDALKSKNIKEDLIYKESRFYLTKIFNEYIKNNYIPEKLRTGPPLVKGDIISVNLRFIKTTGKTEGKIIIIKKKNSLFIKDFKGDLSLLDSEQNTEKAKYEPEIYEFN